MKKGIVNITISVDTQKLLDEFPRGGKITNRTIIEMTDDQPDSKYDDDGGGRFKDKRHTMVSWGDTIRWEIKSSGANDLEFTDCSYDDNFLKLIEDRPRPESGNPSVWTATVKQDQAKILQPWYTYSFCLKSNPGITWSWDPLLENRR